MSGFVAPALFSVLQDTVAYVTKPSGPPDSSAYMWAGYAVTAAAYGGYLVLLLRRIARERNSRRG